MQTTAVQRLSGRNRIALACGADAPHPLYFKCSTPKQMQVNFPPTSTTIHFESISTHGKQLTGRSEPTVRAPDKVCIRHRASVSFGYLFKQSYTADGSRADLISTDDNPIPKGLIL